MGAYRQKLFLVIIVLLLGAVFLSQTTAAMDIAVANSQDWSDVYSVLLHEGLQGNRAFFLNSDSILSLSKVVSKDDQLSIYQSSNNPFISNLNQQLSSVGYTTSLKMTSANLNLDLDPQTGTYYVISSGNPRISLSLAPLAIKENAWVLIVDRDSLPGVVQRLAGAQKVVAVGNFGRDVLDKIKPYFTDWINTNDLFKDSQEISKRFGINGNVVLADGGFLEAEFFSTKNPVLLSGHNKILDNTFEFLSDNNVKSTVIVGNELAVVGEQIREKSNKKISVFVKFGQSDTLNSGKVYALTMFPLPRPRIALTVEKTLYNPKTKELIASYRNPGNIGVYELTSLSVKNGATEIGTASDADVVYIGSGELLPVTYKINIDPADIDEGTVVEFYTSFGLNPSSLDTFLTMKNTHGPPFSLPLLVADIADDPSTIEVSDVAYYKGLKRVGVSVYNNGTNPVHFDVKINGLIVNGLEKNLFKSDIVLPGELKTTYLPVELDAVDLEENDLFDVLVIYGQNEDLLLKNIKVKYPFTIKSGNALTGFVTGVGGGSMAVGLIVILVIIAGLFGLFLFLKKKNNSVSTPSKRVSPTRKKVVKKSPARKKIAKKTTTAKKRK